MACNYIGRLNELGTKCKFVVHFEVDCVPSSSATPNFKASVRIPEYSIHVEQTKGNKKAAKAAAAQLAYEKICESIQESCEKTVDEIANKLKSLGVNENKKLTAAANFAKKLARLDVSGINIENGYSFSELDDRLSKLDILLAYYSDKVTDNNETEYQFICEVSPMGLASPVIFGFGWSSSSQDDAKQRAVNQLLTILKAYSSLSSTVQ